MNEKIPPTKKNLEEALELSEGIIKNIELSEENLSVIVLKTIRLSRLLNDFKMTKILEYESSGYPKTPSGISKEIGELGKISNRIYQERNDNTGEKKEYMYCESIGSLEFKVSSYQTYIESAKDPNVSISSANPYQRVINPQGNMNERIKIRNDTIKARERLEERRSFIYDYALKKYIELKYSKISEDIFSRVRIKVDRKIDEILPESVKRFTAIYDNLKTENPENWSNAVHSCRRILKDLADAIFPPIDERIVEIDGEERQIKLGENEYINRILTFISDHRDSESFEKVVGSHIRYIEDRLKSLLKGAHKGTHDTIISKEDADRYVIYTYLIVGDILSLTNELEK